MKYFYAIAAVAFLSLGAYNYAHADERTDCKQTMTALVEAIQQTPDARVVPLDARETMALLEKNGAPPVAAPFSFSTATTPTVGALIIHDGDCVLSVIGPAPVEELNKFLGRVEASNG